MPKQLLGDWRARSRTVSEANKAIPASRSNKVPVFFFPLRNEKNVVNTGDEQCWLLKRCTLHHWMNQSGMWLVSAVSALWSGPVVRQLDPYYYYLLSTKQLHRSVASDIFKWHIWPRRHKSHNIYVGEFQRQCDPDWTVIVTWLLLWTIAAWSG